VVVVKTLIYWKINGGAGKSVSVLGMVYGSVFAHGHSTEWTSLAFAVCFVAVCFLPNWVLWRRKIFLKL
jgi:predicted acyltransferase